MRYKCGDIVICSENRIGGIILDQKLVIGDSYEVVSSILEWQKTDVLERLDVYSPSVGNLMYLPHYLFIPISVYRDSKLNEILK